MLVQNNNWEGQICAIKLITGEEIVAKVASETTDHYNVERACNVVPGQQGVGLIQALFTADPHTNASIQKSHVVMIAECIDQIKTHYIKTTTGLEIVKP
jgi:hypothetical protein